MQLLRYIVRPLSPWGTPLRSDTLCGLLLYHLSQRRGSDAYRRAIEAFRAGKPPFVLSSAMPMGMVFSPRLPQVPRARFQQWVQEGAFQNAEGKALSIFDALQAYKRFRKTQWLPVNVWMKHASNLSLRPLLTWFCQKEEAAAASCESIEPHVSIDRQNGVAAAGGLFFNRLRWFAKDTAFHIYARTADSSALLELLSEVGDLGFGKDSSTGKGRFAVETDADFVASALENGQPHALLCSVCAAMDMSAMDGWYAVEAKRGKAGPTAVVPHKAPMLLVQEGSILRTLPTGPYLLEGINADASVIQVTQPLTLPCRVAEEEFDA